MVNLIILKNLLLILSKKKFKASIAVKIRGGKHKICVLLGSRFHKVKGAKAKLNILPVMHGHTSMNVEQRWEGACMHLSVCLSICLSFCLPLSVSLSRCLSVCLSVSASASVSLFASFQSIHTRAQGWLAHWSANELFGFVDLRLCVLVLFRLAVPCRLCVCWL